jgi:hypothetical protein
MRKEYVGKVKEYSTDSRRNPYTVILVEMPSHLDYRIFVPGQEFLFGDKIRVILEQTQKEKKGNEPDGNKG